MLVFTVPEERKKKQKTPSYVDLSACGLVKVTAAILMYIFVLFTTIMRSYQ